MTFVTILRGDIGDPAARTCNRSATARTEPSWLLNGLHATAMKEFAALAVLEAASAAGGLGHKTGMF